MRGKEHAHENRRCGHLGETTPGCSLVTPVISAPPPPFSQPGACASFRQGVHGQCSEEHETRMLSFVVLISKAETQNIADLGEYTHACSVSERQGQGLPGNQQTTAQGQTQPADCVYK